MRARISEEVEHSPPSMARAGIIQAVAELALAAQLYPVGLNTAVEQRAGPRRYRYTQGKVD